VVVSTYIISLMYAGCLLYIDVSCSDLRYISIPQYIDTVNKYRDTILHLEYRDTQNTLIKQSVIVLLEYIREMQ